MQSKKLLSILGITALALIFVGAGCEKQSSNAPASNSSAQKEEQNANSAVKQPSSGSVININAEITENRPDVNSPAEAKPSVKTFNVEGGMFYFNPKEIRVKKGDTVKIVFTNKEGFHDWTIDEFNARTPQIATGKTETIQFIADKTGTFEYYCSVGNHRALGMKGNLVVE